MQLARTPQSSSLSRSISHYDRDDVVNDSDVNHNNFLLPHDYVYHISLYGAVDVKPTFTNKLNVDLPGLPCL